MAQLYSPEHESRLLQWYIYLPVGAREGLRLRSVLHTAACLLCEAGTHATQQQGREGEGYRGSSGDHAAKRRNRCPQSNPLLTSRWRRRRPQNQCA